MRIVSDSATKVIRPDDREVARFEVVAQTVIISDGSVTTETRDSAVVEVLVSPVVDTQAVIRPAGFTDASGWWFYSEQPDVALAYQDGQVTRVSDGSAWIGVTDGRFTRRYSVTVSRSSPPELVRLLSWVAGSVEGFSADQIGSMTDGVTASTSTRALFVGGVRNASLFCADYTQSLTAIVQTSSRHGSWYGLTAITRRHVLGCQHALHFAGDMLGWKTATNVTVTRIISEVYLVPGKDACLYVIDSDLPESISPMAVPPPDVLDYIRNFNLGCPLLFSDKDHIVSVAMSDSLTDDSFLIEAPPAGDPLRDFYTRPVLGTSGHRVMMPFSASDLMVMGTFTSPWHGPSYHAVDWSTVIASADAAAGLERTNLLTHSSDPADAAWTKSGTVTVNEAVGTAPDGTMTASRVVFGSGATNNNGGAYQIVEVEEGEQYTNSIWVKKDTTDGDVLLHDPFIGAGSTVVTLTDEWQRITMTENKSTHGGVWLRKWSEGLESVLVWNAQLEAGPVATPDIVTDATPITQGTGYLPEVADLSGFTFFGDPLEGVPTVGVFVTHYGDNVPVGMYQDTGCTTPAVEEGDPVNAWKDEVSGLVFENIGISPAVLEFRSGVPTIKKGMDNVGPFRLSNAASLFSGNGSVSTRFTLDSDSGYTVITSNALSSGHHDRYDGNGYSYPMMFNAPRVEGYREMPTGGTHTLTTTVTDGTYENWLDGVSGGAVAATYNLGSNAIYLANGGNNPADLDGVVTGVILGPAWTSEQRMAVQSYLEGLYP